MYEVEYACTLHPQWYADLEYPGIQQAMERALWLYQTTGRSVRVVDVYGQVLYLIAGNQHPGCG